MERKSYLESLTPNIWKLCYEGESKGPILMEFTPRIWKFLVSFFFFFCRSSVSVTLSKTPSFLFSPLVLLTWFPFYNLQAPQVTPVFLCLAVLTLPPKTFRCGYPSSLAIYIINPPPKPLKHCHHICSLRSRTSPPLQTAKKCSLHASALFFFF